MQHEIFDWDSDKAVTNLSRHGVGFENAATILSDPFADRYHVEAFDVKHSTEDEDRWITVGSDPARRSVVLVVCWTPRLDESDGMVTRIISARPATRAERRAYENKTGQV